MSSEAEIQSRSFYWRGFGLASTALADSGDTIRYDDGLPCFGMWLPGYDVYWAMRFTPLLDCSLREAQCHIWVDSGTPPVCTLIVWDDNGGQPGDRLFQSEFTPRTGLNIVDISPPLPSPESVDFWLGYYLEEPSGGDSTLAVADSGIDHNDRSGVCVSGIWYTMDDLAGEGDLVLRALVSYHGNHDLGADSIAAPPDTVRPGLAFDPAVWIQNYGDFEESFSVECLIQPGGYVDTEPVSSLGPDASHLCVFNQWSVPPDDSTTYTVCMRISLASDQNPLNDSLCKQVFSVTGIVSEESHLYAGSPGVLSVRPNPFSRDAMVSYELEGACVARLSVRDIAGRLIRELADGFAAAGTHTVSWDGRDSSGIPVSEGVYFCDLSAGQVHSAAKVVVLR